MTPLKLEDLQPIRPLLRTYLKKEVSPATIWRWTKKGVRGGAKLETVRMGIQLYTTAEAVQRFAAACDADPHTVELPGDQVPTTIIPGPIKSRATDAELKACGLL